MRKTIDFPPYTEAEIKEIYDDGSALCDLYGAGYSDTDICFPAGSGILQLSVKEEAAFYEEKENGFPG